MTTGQDQDGSGVDRTSRAILGVMAESGSAVWERDEIVRAIATDLDSSAERDQVDIGLHDLVAAGLVHQTGRFFFLSRPAHAALDLLDL